MAAKPDIDSLPDEILTEVLLHLPTPTALVHAKAVNSKWRGAIANDGFLKQYRERHTSLPFLGLYVPRQFGGTPLFQTADSIGVAQEHDADLSDAINRASKLGPIRWYQDHRLHDDAFHPSPLPVHPDYRLLDCHNSRLLLTRGDEALEVRSPLARDSILLPFPRYTEYLEQGCLLQGHDGSAAGFRVVYVQHRPRHNRREARAVEYDSRRKSWQYHPWELLDSNFRGTPQQVMHAGHRIFCTYTGLTSIALMLDTSDMKFSLHHLPSDNKKFVIGEIEDIACCFLESDGCADHRLRMWQLDEKKLGWDLKKDVQMREVLGKYRGYYRPRAISNGTALLCSATTHPHFVVDLNTWRIKDKFEFGGQFAYPMQMPWPAFSTAAVEPKSCRQKSPNLPHCANGEGADDGGSSNQSSKVSNDEGLSPHTTVTPDVDRISDVLPTDAFEPGNLPECITTQDTAMISQPDSRKAHLSALQHERGEKVNQDLEYVCASIRPVEKDHAHGDLTLQSAGALLSISCNGANQGSKSETNLQPGTAAIEDRMDFEEQNSDEPPLEVSGANKANQPLHDDGSMMKNNTVTVTGGLIVQTAPVSQNCNVTLHDKTSEANCFSEKKNEKNRTDVQKDNLRTSIPCSSKDRDRESAKKKSNEEKKTYCEAWKDVVDFLATAQVSKQHDEQLNGVQPGPANRDGHSNGCGTSKRNSIHHDEAYDLVQEDEEPHQPRKKHKINARGNGYPKEVLTEKVPFENSGPDPEKKQQAGDKEAAPRKRRLTEKVPLENSGPDLEKKQKKHSNRVAPTGRCDKRSASSQRCDPSWNLDGEADQEDSLVASNQTSGSDEIEATSSNDLGKQSSPPWRNTRHSKKRLHEMEPAVPSISRKGTAKQSRHVPQKRYSNRVARSPTGRRNSVKYTEKEVAFLRDAINVNLKVGEKIPWTKILKDGRHVFEKTRTTGDLQSKWCIMKNKTDQHSCNRDATTEKRGKLSWTEKEEACLRDAVSKVNSKVGERISWTGILKDGRRVFDKTRTPCDLKKKWYVLKKKTNLHSCNRVAPNGRRDPTVKRDALPWTEKEEAKLGEAMTIFTPQDGARIPWTQILEYGRHVFDKTRLPMDLRNKWRNMKKKKD